jgi:hypothetical protein
MGVLDDAIKEHLELKRKHGVPEEELQRQEEEALGPARREVAQQHEDAEPAAAHTATADAAEPEAPEAPEADQDTALFDMEADGAPDAESGAEETHAAMAEPDVPDADSVPDEPLAAEAPPATSRPIEIHEPGEDVPAEPERHAALGDTEPHGFEAAEDEEESGAEPGEEPASEDEREPDDEELLSAEEEAAAEEGDPDVLEDTPDFLQETPEHDRLWFEQKPPRDFDFD